ncbi:MAG: abfA [Streptosporangiaceae bacterium]|nr:abfA [Streptosporangiaceae bacterium]
MRRIIAILVLCAPLLGLPDLTWPDPAQAAAPAGQWRFDEGQGAVAADGSGNQHDGTLTGGASWAPGRDRTLAVTADGSGAFVDVPSPVVDTTRSFTVMAWVRFDATTGFHTVVGVDGDRVSGFYLQSRGDDGRFAFTRLTSDSTTATHVRAEASAGPQPGTWYHLAGVYDAAERQISLYVNGAFQQAVAFTAPWRARGHLTIGRGQWAGAPADHVRGTIDDVRLYRAALTAEELKGFTDRPALGIDASRAGPALDSGRYGLSLAQTGRPVDDGLSAELVGNGSLQQSGASPAHWAPVTGGVARGSIALDLTRPRGPAADRSLRLGIDRLGPGGRVGAANDGLRGVALKPRTAYTGSFDAMATPGFSGRVAMSLEAADGRVLARARAGGVSADRWRRREVTLTTPAEVPAGMGNRIVVAAESSCVRACPDMSGQAVWLSAVSVAPPTYKGHGLRADLMAKLAALRPGLLRVPGGDTLQGGRPALLAHLRMAEDLGAEPVLALYAGYSPGGSPVPAGRLRPYVQDALSTIEYATGPVTSPGGARRARDGHPAPFRIRYVEVGNEDWFDRSGSYEQRYAAFYDAIRRSYPRLKVIASTQVNSRSMDAVDDHYSGSPSWFTGNAGRYDAADRRGPKILVGEYSSPAGSPTGTLDAALGEAGFLTGLDRNADVVIGSMHAPLVASGDSPNTRTSLVGADAATSYGSPSYYALRMFADHRGDHVLHSLLSGGDPGLRTVVTRAGPKVYVKVVNSAPTDQALQIQVTGVSSVAPQGQVTVLTGDPALRNTPSEPALISPRTRAAGGLGKRFGAAFPAHSFTIITLTVSG